MSLRVWAPGAAQRRAGHGRAAPALRAAREAGGRPPEPLLRARRRLRSSRSTVVLAIPDPRERAAAARRPWASRAVDHAAFEWHDAGFRPMPLPRRRHLRDALSARSARRARSTAPSNSSTISSSWASRTSSSCPSTPSPAVTAGATTWPASSRRTNPTADRTASSGWWMPATTADWRCCSMSSTTTLARRAATCRISGPTSPIASRRPGVAPSTWVTPAPTRCGASSSTTR